MLPLRVKFPVTHLTTGAVVENLGIGYCILNVETLSKSDKCSLKKELDEKVLNGSEQSSDSDASYGIIHSRVCLKNLEYVKPKEF